MMAPLSWSIVFGVQFHCKYCDLLIPDVKSSGVMRLVECWLPAGKSTGALRVEEKFLYAHRICVEMGKMEAAQESLF